MKRQYLEDMKICPICDNYLWKTHIKQMQKYCSAAYINGMKHWAIIIGNPKVTACGLIIKWTGKANNYEVLYPKDTLFQYTYKSLDKRFKFDKRFLDTLKKRIKINYGIK